MGRRVAVERAVIGGEQILGERDLRGEARRACARNRGAPSLRHASNARRRSSPCTAGIARSWNRTLKWSRITSQGSPGELVHLGGELDVELGHAAGVVGGQRHLDVLVDIEPLGMVIHLFGDQRRPGHEAEGLVEVLEHELPGDGVAARHLAPAVELAERIGSGPVRSVSEPF